MQENSFPHILYVYTCFGLAFHAPPAHTLLLVLVSLLAHIMCLDSFPVLLVSRGQSKTLFCVSWVVGVFWGFVLLCFFLFFNILKQPLYNLLNLLLSVFKENSFRISEIPLGLIVVVMCMSFQPPCANRLIVSSVLKCCSIYSLSNSFFFIGPNCVFIICSRECTCSY